MKTSATTFYIFSAFALKNMSQIVMINHIMILQFLMSQSLKYA
jgi:hypothetical protein